LTTVIGPWYCQNGRRERGSTVGKAVDGAEEEGDDGDDGTEIAK
jgi:hypothetical protein